MASKVYSINLRATQKENLVGKIQRLVETAGLSTVVRPRDLVAVKLHFGELGNTAFIRPVFLRRIVAAIRSAGGHPFLTDANTLYAGTRSDAPHHITTAIQNGFAYSVVEAPIIIADGLRGKSEVGIATGGKQVATAYIGTDIAEADALVSVAHFKGHELSGFGGTIKNLGMGCASRRGKMAQHSSLSPKVQAKKCIGCGDCEDHCSQAAIAVAEEKASIDPEKCIGCGECILVCPQEAIQIRWNQSIPVFMEKMVEYTAAVLHNKKQRALFLNFITDVSPACDCYGMNDAPIVRDVGILAANDPVAIDQAAVDLVNREPALADSCLEVNTGPGEDKFKGVYPKVDWQHQLAYAERIGLGSRTYELIRI